MRKKSEMAEWILDFFRRARVDAGQIIMFRSIQQKVYELNPKERELFVPVVNELIENGYFTYEEGTLQCLRLTEKGRDYIYAPEAVLDCCQDRRKATKKDYAKVVEIGLKMAEIAIRGRVDNVTIVTLVKQISEIATTVDDEELLALIDKHIGVVDEMRSSMSDIIWNQEVKETAEKAVNHLESLGEQEISNHLKELIGK
jgi:hypothetical protein